MRQAELELTTHLGFQLSLLRLWTIPGPSHGMEKEDWIREARQLEKLVRRGKGERANAEAIANVKSEPCRGA